MPDSTKIIKTALECNGIYTDDEKIHLLAEYLTELLRVNEFMNLTAIRDFREAAVKNIADCALCAEAIPKNARLLDVGSGAGLPAFPFAILRPDISVTALDSTGKKIKFISDTAELLSIGNLKTVCGRAEELARTPECREAFDAVSARAVARLNILAELCLPFVKIGGVFIAMKSRLASEELNEAGKGIALLGGRTEKIERAFLLGLSEKQERTAIVIRKISATPNKYPREYKHIFSKPLK